MIGEIRHIIGPCFLTCNDRQLFTAGQRDRAFFLPPCDLSRMDGRRSRYWNLESASLLRSCMSIICISRIWLVGSVVCSTILYSSITITGLHGKRQCWRSDILFRWSDAFSRDAWTSRASLLQSVYPERWSASMLSESNFGGSSSAFFVLFGVFISISLSPSRCTVGKQASLPERAKKLRLPSLEDDKREGLSLESSRRMMLGICLLR